MVETQHPLHGSKIPVPCCTKLNLSPFFPYLTANVFIPVSRSYSFWVSANDQNSEGQWRWVDGRKVPQGVWASGQPNKLRSVGKMREFFWINSFIDDISIK